MKVMKTEDKGCRLPTLAANFEKGQVKIKVTSTK